MNDLNIGDDNFQEAISLKPLIGIGKNESPLKVYEHFTKHKLAFDMGEVDLQ